MILEVNSNDFPERSCIAFIMTMPKHVVACVSKIFFGHDVLLRYHHAAFSLFWSEVAGGVLLGSYSTILAIAVPVLHSSCL